MYTAAQHDESTSLTKYVTEQLAAIRAAAYGLTEEQFRARPCRSELSIGGIIKHATQGMTGVTARLAGEPTPPLNEKAFAAHMAAFHVGEDEQSTEALARFDTARVSYLEAMAAANPSGEAVAPPAPWHGVFDERPMLWRFYLTHQVEEFARHAGHADIIREELDGTAVPALVLTLEGAPANDFFQPFVPEPGTIGAE